MLAPRSLVVLVGASGSGKTTFARKHFLETQVVSSDRCRAIISDDQYRIDISDQAFELLYDIIRRRLNLGRTTVVDSTAVEDFARANLLRIADDFGFRKIAVVFDIPEAECVRRDGGRAHPVGRRIIHDQRANLEAAFETLDREGWDEVHVVKLDNESAMEVRQVEVEAAAG